LRNQPAHRHSGEAIEQRQHGLPGRAADILKVDVDAIGTGLGQLLGKIGYTVINCRVEANLVLHVAALASAAGDADRLFRRVKYYALNPASAFRENQEQQK
jgi:hypothetical protein